MDDAALLHELEPEAARLLERHLSKTKSWMPHELVPWSRGRDFEQGYEWSPDEVQLDESVRSALYVNLLTEDNLPYYFRDIERMFGRDGAWGEWNRRWTAEEGRHSIVIRDYLTVTRAIDPVELELGRMAQVSAGEVPEPPTVCDGLAYVCLQELATRITHFNTGKIVDDEAGYKIMSKVAADENLHYLFYRDIAKAAIEVDPSSMMRAIEANVRDFEMPGTGIPNFGAHSKLISRAGIYNFQIHYDQILNPVVMRFWDVEHIEGLDADAEQARERLVAKVDQVRRVGERLADRRASESPPAVLAREEQDGGEEDAIDTSADDALGDEEE